MIKLWTFLEGDNQFRQYEDAVESATEILNKIGYLVDVVTFQSGSGISAQEWEHNIIIGLKKNEAFLEVSTQIKKYVITSLAPPTGSVITNERGAVIFSQDWHRPYDSVQTNYTCQAHSRLYVSWNNPARNAFVPIYSKTQKLESRDIYLAVNYTLRGVPASKHPVIITTKKDTLKNSSIPIEITLFGGYTLPSKMDVIEESTSTDLYAAKFSGNIQYGLEAGLGISRNFDLNIQYRRLGSLVDVNTPKQSEAGSVTIYQNYMLIGTDYNFRVSKKISPYGGICLGGLNMVPSDKYFMNVWYFIMGGHGGAKFYLSKRIGIRIEAEILYQLHPVKAPFLYSDDVYKNTPVAAMSNMVQVGISAGFIIRLGN